MSPLVNEGDKVGVYRRQRVGGNALDLHLLLIEVRTNRLSLVEDLLSSSENLYFIPPSSSSSLVETTRPTPGVEYNLFE